MVVAAVGAGIFLLGSIFLLRFAIEQGWIGPALRFLFGLAVGTALAVPAVRHLAAGRAGFGSSLLAAGLGTIVFTLYVGCFRYGFYARELGFGLAVIACVAGGALAARVRIEPAFVVAYFAAFVSPFVFATGEMHLVELGAFELAIFVAALAVAELAPEARTWTFSHWLVTATQGFVLFGSAAAARHTDEPTLMALAGVGLALAAIWIWRWHAREPIAGSPALLWSLVSLGSVATMALHWRALAWPNESFAVFLLLLAVAEAGLAFATCRSPRSAGSETLLLVLAGGLGVAAVPVAWGWEWAGPLWGSLAVLALATARHLAGRPDVLAAEARALALLGTGLAALTTLRWLVVSGLPGLDGGATRVPFWNGVFLTAALAATAWLLLARLHRAGRVAGFAAFEIVANVALAYELASLVGTLGGSARARLVTLTIVWSVSGAVHWLAGLRRRDEIGRGLVGAGYLGLAIAAGKLVVVDLDQAPLALRALAFLLAGAIFLGAALLANRLSPGDQGAS